MRHAGHIRSLQIQIVNTQVPAVCFVLGPGLDRCQKDALTIFCNPNFLFGFQVLTTVCSLQTLLPDT